MNPEFRPLGLGRRGVMLLLMAMLWVWVITRGVVLSDAGPVDGLFHTHWPDWVRLVEWYGAALIAVACAWRERDGLGWVALLLPPLIRAGSYLWGWIVWLVPGGGEGYALGIWDAWLYLFMVGVVLNCSGWADYPPRKEKAQ